MGQRDDFVAAMKAELASKGADAVVVALTNAGFFARFIIPLVLGALALASLIPGVAERLTRTVLVKVLSKALEIPEFMVFAWYTDMRVDAQGEEAMNATIEYWKTAEKKGVSREEFDRAEARRKNAYRPFIDFRS